MLSHELRVFISSTTSDLKNYREAVKEILLTSEIFPVIQENFPPDYHKLTEYLQDKIAHCDAVICLIGLSYGAAPENVKSHKRSYTQIEYYLAQKLEKPTYIFLTNENFVPNNKINESTEEITLQKNHRQFLLENHKCEWFESVEELREKVSQVTRQIKPHLPIFYLHPPSPPTYFAGRVEEIAQLDEAVLRKIPSTILVVGMGGQGKTTLVYQWLRQKKHINFSAAIWCTAYRGGYSFDMFLDDALSYLLHQNYNKLELPDIKARCRKLLGLLQQQPTLVIIDGIERWLFGWHKTFCNNDLAETIEDRSGFYKGLDEFLGEISGITNGSHFILTTRAVPTALEDVEYTTIPVYEEPDEDLYLKGLDPDASVSLLRRLGVKAEDEQIKQLAASFAYHPLALNILGRLLSKKFGGRIENIPGIALLDPKRSLFKLFEEIRQNLPGNLIAEQVLSVASFSLENPNLSVIAAVLPPSIIPRDDIVEQVIILDDWNLVSWEGNSETIHIHPLVKQYFSSLVDENETKKFHDRYSDWYSDQIIPNDASSLEQVRPLVLAVEHALSAGNIQRCRDLIFSPLIDTYPLIEWLSLWGHQTAGIELIARISELSPPVPRSEFLTARAALLRQLGSLTEAHQELDESISLLESEVDKPNDNQKILLAGAYMNRGNVRWQASKLNDAINDYNRSFHIFKQLPKNDLNKEVQIACVLMNRGIAFREMGCFSKAFTDCDLSLQMYRKFVNNGLNYLEQTLITGLINRGNILADLYNHEEAINDFDEAMDLCQHNIDSGHQELIPLKIRAQVMKAATLNTAGNSKTALEEASMAITVLRELVNSGRNDLEALLALSILGRSSSKIQLELWQEALEDCEMTLDLYGRLIKDGRDDLIGWRAHALMNRAESQYKLGNEEIAAQDRNDGFKIMHHHIDKGEPETRVLLLYKSVSAAKYMILKEPKEAMDILEIAVVEAEKGIAEGHAVEALRIEAKRSLDELSFIQKNLTKVNPDNMIIKRLKKLAKST